jgi:hypothetical protein
MTSTENVTVNSVITAYSTVQGTSTSLELIRYEVWPYDYDNLTGTFSLWQMNTRFLPCCMGDWEDIPCEYYDYFLFNAIAGQELRGQFTTEQERSVGFYVLNSAQFQRFGSSGCVIGGWGWEVFEFGPAGDFNWTVPETGEYTFLFLSRQFYGGHIHFTAQAYSTVETATVSTFVVASAYTLQSSEILVSTQSTASTPNSTTTNDALPATILITAIAILIAAIFAKARRKSPQRTI